jgi:cytochrome c biogenesis factor
LIRAGEEKAVDAPKKDILVVEISKKPMINILWFGTILVIGGQVIAFRKRYKESK